MQFNYGGNNVQINYGGCSPYGCCNQAMFCGCQSMQNICFRPMCCRSPLRIGLFLITEKNDDEKIIKDDLMFYFEVKAVLNSVIAIYKKMMATEEKEEAKFMALFDTEIQNRFLVMLKFYIEVINFRSKILEEIVQIDISDVDAANMPKFRVGQNIFLESLTIIINSVGDLTRLINSYMKSELVPIYGESGLRLGKELSDELDQSCKHVVLNYELQKGKEFPKELPTYYSKFEISLLSLANKDLEDLVAIKQ